MRLTSKQKYELYRVRSSNPGEDQLKDLAEGTGRHWIKCQCGRHYLGGTEYIHLNTIFHKERVR